MSVLKGRRSQALQAPSEKPQDAPSAPVDPVQGGDIPDHVWALLQASGEQAAQRLLDILQSPRFPSMAPSAQARLIELAMVRAYGLPVRRSVDVQLTSSDADAVAASLQALQDHLPERQGRPRTRVVEGQATNVPEDAKRSQ